MKIKKEVYFLLLALVGFTIFVLYRNTYVEFEPTLFTGEGYEVIKVDDQFYKDFEKVFHYYEVNYNKSQQGNFLVQRKVSADKELIFNFTNKALDSVWLQSH